MGFMMVFVDLLGCGTVGGRGAGDRVALQIQLLWFIWSSPHCFIVPVAPTQHVLPARRLSLGGRSGAAAEGSRDAVICVSEPPWAKSYGAAALW